MHVVLWDTRKLDVSKDFAGGFGIGQYTGDGSFRSRMIRHFYTRDRRPVAVSMPIWRPSSPAWDTASSMPRTGFRPGRTCTFSIRRS